LPGVGKTGNIAEGLRPWKVYLEKEQAPQRMLGGNKLIKYPADNILYRLKKGGGKMTIHLEHQKNGQILLVPRGEDLIDDSELLRGRKGTS